LDPPTPQYPSQGDQAISRPYNPFRFTPNVAKPVEIGGGIPQFPVVSHKPDDGPS